MNLRILAASLLIVSSVLCRASHAADDKVYSLGKAGTLHVALPGGWTGESNGLTPVTITLKAPADKHVSIQLTPEAGDTTDAELKQGATVIGRMYAASSAEKKVTLETVKGAAVSGYVSSYTDNSADPGEFKFVTAGVLASNKQLMSMTLLYNDKASPDRKAAMEVLKSLSITAAGGAPTVAPTTGGELKIKSPDGTWTLVIPGKWNLGEDKKAADGKSRRISAVSEDAMLMTVFLEPAVQPKGDATACREYYLARMKQNPLGMDHLKKAVVGEVATLEYDQGIDDMKPHNLNAYLAHAGIWVDVHISAPVFEEKAHRPFFTALVKGLKAVDDKPPSVDAPAKPGK